MLSPENRQRLLKYDRHIKSWHFDQSTNIDPGGREEIQAVIRTVEPGYSAMLWCTHCVGQMLDKAYNLLYGNNNNGGA